MKKSRRIFGIMVLFFCFLSFPVNHVFAASGMAEVSLRVTQNFAVKNPAKKMDFTGNYEFSALDKGAPLPEKAENGKYSFSLEGEKAELPIHLQYSHAGVYQYRLIQTTEDKEGYQYDKNSYQITVYVKNSDKGELHTQVVAEKENGRKSGRLEFQNFYQGKEPDGSDPNGSNGSAGYGGSSANPVKTGDSTNITPYILTAAAALLLAAVIVFVKKFNRKKE